MKRRVSGERDLYLKEIISEKETLLKSQGEDLIRGFAWATKDRIVYMQDKGGDENYHIYGVDISGANDVDLTPYDGVRANILSSLKEDTLCLRLVLAPVEFNEARTYNLCYKW